MTVNLVISIFSALLLIISGVKDEREKSKSIAGKNFNLFSLGIILAIISAGILVWTSVIAGNAEANTNKYQINTIKQDSVIQKKSDSLLLLALQLVSKNDTLNKKNDELNTKSDQLRLANLELEKKSQLIIGSQFKQLAISNKNLQLQSELINHSTGGNSIPLLEVDTMRHFISTSPSDYNPKSLVLTLVNYGDYRLHDVQIKYEFKLRYPTDTTLLPSILNLDPGEHKKILGTILNTFPQPQSGFTLSYIISWSNGRTHFINYTCRINVDISTEWGRNDTDLQPAFFCKTEYLFNNKKFDKAQDLEKAILKTFK